MSVFLFVVGLVSGLILETYVPPEKDSVETLYWILTALVIGWMLLALPDVFAWWRRKKGRPLWFETVLPRWLAVAIAHELDKIYTRRHAEQIVREFRPSPKDSEGGR